MLFDVATPIAMMQPISDGTLIVVRVMYSAHRTPRQRARQRRENDQGVSPRLEIETTIRKYTSSTANKIPSPIWKNDWFMLCTCPRTTIELALEICWLYFGDDPAHLT